MQTEHTSDLIGTSFDKSSLGQGSGKCFWGSEATSGAVVKRHSSDAALLLTLIVTRRLYYLPGNISRLLRLSGLLPCGKEVWLGETSMTLAVADLQTIEAVSHPSRGTNLLDDGPQKFFQCC